jgi:glycosyltransferase involved in cell wall biosynthesis
MNIAAFVWGEHPSANYRAHHPLRELVRHGHVVALYPDEDQLTPTDEELEALVEEFDVVLMVRWSQTEAQELARRLRDAGMPVVWDYDDDVRSEEYIQRVTAMSRAVDVVTTTNDYLAGRYRDRGAHEALAIPNFVTREAAATPRRKHDGLVLGYIGWIDHQDDWDALGLHEIVTDLLDRHEDLRVETVGPLELRLPTERHRNTRLLPFDRLPQAIAGFDLAIAPLIDKIGNDTRSDIKLKEYAIAGVPWLASPLGAYRGHGEEHGGRLVEDGDWFDALDDLISDRKARKKLAKNGQKWARGQTLERNVHVWEEALEDAIELAEERGAAVG